MNPSPKPVNEPTVWDGVACRGAPERGVLKPARPTLAMLRIPVMHCASHVGVIRRALEPLPVTRSLSFQLGARTAVVDIDVDAQHRPAGSRDAVEHGGSARDCDFASDDHDHRCISGVGRLGAALGLAIAAEASPTGARVCSWWRTGCDCCATPSMRDRVFRRRRTSLAAAHSAGVQPTRRMLARPCADPPGNSHDGGAR